MNHDEHSTSPPKGDNTQSRLPGFLRRNPGGKLLAVFIALLLWVYVINVMDPAPMRQKTVTVRLYFQNAAMLDKNLIVANDPSEILKEINLTVEAKVNEIGYVNSGNVSAYVDLSEVRAAGDGQRLEIHPDSAYGKVVGKSQSYVTVDIDERAALAIPIDVHFEGALPEGYWRAEPVLTPAEIDLVGPKSEIQKLKSAVCTLSLDGRTSNINEALPVSLFDTSGQPIDDATFLDMLSSVGVTMDVYPKKTVPLDTKGTVQGDVKAGYHVDTIQTSPNEIEIAAPREILDSIASIPVNMLNIEDMDKSVTTSRPLQLPEGVVWSSFASTSINVAISEDRGTDSYDGFQIEIRGLDRDLTGTLSQDNVRVDVEGPLSQIRALRRQDIEVYIDVSSLGAGIYTWPVSIALPEEAPGVTASCVPSNVTVTISQK